MTEEFLKNLKKATEIEPSVNFKDRSRRLIFSSHQNRPALGGIFFNHPIGVTLGFAGVFAVFAATFLLYQGVFLGQEANELLSEAERLEFKIHLKEAEYFDNSAKEVAAILNKIEEDLQENN